MRRRHSEIFGNSEVNSEAPEEQDEEENNQEEDTSQCGLGNRKESQDLESLDSIEYNAIQRFPPINERGLSQEPEIPRVAIRR